MSDLIDAVRDENETALSRIGSSKMLYALTGGELDADHVGTAVATDAARARTVFEDWAADEDDATAAEAFTAAAETAQHALDVADADPADDAQGVYDALAALDTTERRAGGLLGHALVSRAVAEQLVGFFVGNADPTTASDYRDVKSGYDDQADAAADLVDAVCADAADREVAEAAANDVVQAAYDWYVETLEGMGVKPKNVC